MKAALSQKLLSEFLGTALLLAVVIGSGIMAERLAGGNAAIALPANTLATVGAPYVLIEVFGPIGGAHFNPAVSLTMAWRGHLPWSMLGPYVACQLAGAVLGAWLAHAMFDQTIVQFSTKVRTGTGQWIAEAVATFGLLLVILRAQRTGLPLPHRLRTPQRFLGACSATASPASRPAARWPSWRPSFWVRGLGRLCTACSAGVIRSRPGQPIIRPPLRSRLCLHRPAQLAPPARDPYEPEVAHHHRR